MTAETTYRQATDAEVIGWAEEKWREFNDDEPLDVESFPDVQARYSDAIEATYEHNAGHLVQEVGLWVITDSSGVTDGMLITVDLPNGVRLASLALDYHDLIPDGPVTYAVLLENILIEARALVSEYEKAH